MKDRSAGQGSVDALLERHLDALRAFVRPRLGPIIRSKETSGDIVQSVCRNVLADDGQFEYRGEASFKRWLFQRAEHKIVDRGRFYARHRRDVAKEVPLQRSRRSEGASESAPLPGAESLLTPSRHAAGLEEWACVEQAFKELPEDYREVLVLKRILGLSHAEVAERMGRSDGAVRKTLCRALARLATVLDTGDDAQLAP